MIDFFSIAYLEKGSEKQQAVYRVIEAYHLLNILARFNPVVVGTFPLDIAIDTSDIDIACSFTCMDEFKAFVGANFSQYEGFEATVVVIQNKPTYVVNFTIEQFPIELFAQSIAVTEQQGYRHMVIEYEILQQKGVEFKNQIIALKQAGMKTEPAFARLLNLPGDPYEAVLSLEMLGN